MAIQLGSAYGKVSIDASGVKSGVATATSSLTSLSQAGMQLGRNMQMIGAALTVAVSVPLILIGKSAIQAASDLNDAKDNVKLVFGEMSDSVLKWSENSARALGQSKQQALDGAAAFGLLFVQMGLGPSQAADMSEKMVALATDIAEFNHTDVSTVFGQLQSGLVGRGIELKKFGMDLSEATVKAKALQMKLVAPTVDMDAVNKAMSDLKIAQMKLADVQQSGGVDADKVAAAEERVGKASAAVEDAEIKLQRAERDLAALRQSKSPTALQIAHAEERVADAHKRVEDATNGVADAQNALSKARIPAVPSATRLASAEQGVTEAEQKVSAAMAGQVGDFNEAALVQARYALILEQTTIAQGYFAGKTDDLGKSTKIMKAELQDSLAMLGERMLPIEIKVVDAVIGLLEAFQKLPAPAQDAILVLGGLLILLGPIIGFLGSIVSVVSAVIGAIGLLSGAGVSLAAVGTAIGGIVTALGTVVLPILVIAAALVFLVWAFKTYGKAVQTMMEQLAFLIKVAFKKMWDDINAAGDAAYERQRTATDEHTKAMQAFWQRFGDWLHTAWQNLMIWLGQMAAWGRNAIVSAFNINWATIGSNIINGIINGFNSGVSALVTAATNAGIAALNAIKRALGIASPSIEMFKLGMQSAQGFALGMASGWDADRMAKVLARPMQQMGNQQQVTVNLASGLTVQMASAMIGASEERIMENIYRVLGG